MKLEHTSMIKESVLDKLNFISNAVNKWAPHKLQRSLERTIYEYFRFLRPLRTRTIEIPIEKILGGKLEAKLVVGRWISTKIVSSRLPIRKPNEFMKTIKNHGDKICKVVRKDKRKEFEKLYHLSLKLKNYNQIVKQKPSYTRKVEAKIIKVDFENERIFADWVKIDEIVMSTVYPNIISLRKGNKTIKEINVNSSLLWIFELLSIKNIVDDIVKIYEEMIEDIKPIRMYNEEILKQMEKIIAPYRIAKELK